MEENGQGIIDLDNRSMEEEEEEGETGGGETREDVECNSKEPARRTLSFRNTYKIPKRKAPEFTMLQTLLLSYQSLGVVYGDIGTSPLYVYSSVTLENPTEGDILRLLSLIFWTLTMKGLIKYVLIVLDADDHGEGGTFALYTLIRQHINFKGKMIMPSTRLESDINLRFHSGGSTLHSKAQTFLEENATAQTAITLIVLLATCMLIGDEALTPTISVLSAVQGIQSRSSKITTDDVVWMCVGILLILFLCQRFGTSRVSFTFSPIMLLWFGFNVAIGIYNITTYYPLVLKAISPHYIYYFFERNGKKGWELLGAAALCITGAEAMFADLGHFNKKAIQLAFSFLVYPALILAYAGQAAYLIKNPDNISTTFYSSMPEPLFWVMFVISTLAAIVASQALISASFSIIRQSIALGCFPRVTMIHTSNKHEGQNYSPEINFILMILSIIITVYFKGGVEIGNAYGVAVIWVMLITTFLISIVMIVIWDTNNILVAIFLFIFLSIEGVYMTSLLNKVRAGGWVPFAISAFFIVITLSWTYGRSKKSKYEEMKKMDRTELNELITSSTRVPGVCFFCTDLINGIPPIVRHYVQHIGSLRQVMVFVTVRTLPVKSVLPEERFHVAKLGPYGIYRCLVQYGYMNEHNMEGDEYVQEVIANLKEIAENNQEIQMLDSALNSGAIFVLGRIILKMSNSKDQLGKFVVHYLYRFLQKNFRSNVATLRIPLGKILQVGMVYEIE